ncbi:hypothetical protein G6O67_006710 [Ophiocordyceps sinensis]|uniref:O-methyltransferase C-terminal domain-containing protein n=1 Tax=Ophiocordyceps sinensis TaxID=72228 RepID=A0A8H4LXC4_9HYPO|nr:hypothetical protein G6O67_006710 [Ophiocordyceps sinensis]
MLNTNDKATIHGALAEARQLVASLEAFDGTSNSKLSLLKHANNIRAALEEPFHMANRLVDSTSIVAAFYILIHIKALDKLPTQGSVAAADMATACGVHVSVITRSMRVLVNHGIAHETGRDEYAHNTLSRAFQPDALGSIMFVYGDLMRAWGAVPDYSKSHEPEELHDNRKSPFAFAMGLESESTVFYDVISMDPARRMMWNLTIQITGELVPILGMFPFERLEAQVKREPQRPFVVEIGGGRGQALLAIREHCCGSFGGKMLLQDLPIVIESLKPDEIPGIEPMSYNMFTPQPVTNAHVYLMRNLLVDHPDAVVVDILKNTVSAMSPDSRLIVNDILPPDRVTVGGSTMACLLDFVLLTTGGKARSIGEHRHIFDEVGLELVKVHKSEDGQAVMLETRLKDTVTQGGL